MHRARRLLLYVLRNLGRIVQSLLRSMNSTITVRFPRAMTVVILLTIHIALLGCDRARPLHTSFSQSASTLEVYDVVEVTAKVFWPHARNPFTDASFGGRFETVDGSKRWTVAGFCD